MSRTQLVALRQVVTVNWPQAAAAQARTALLRTVAETHAAILRDQSARAGIAPDFEAYANRPGNSNLAAVQLPGPIVIRYDYRREIVTLALRELKKASPSVSGAYIKAHSIYLNGVLVTELPRRIAPRAEIILSNPLPYVRRLEVGKKFDGSAFVVQVEPHIYERVARRLKTIYGQTVKIEYGYVDLPNAWTIRGTGLGSHYYTTGKRKKGKRILRKRQKRAGQKVRAPAIIITGFLA